MAVLLQALASVGMLLFNKSYSIAIDQRIMHRILLRQ